MSVTVLLFASYADAFGAPSVDVELPANATVADVVAALRMRPGAHVLPLKPLVAVNEKYAHAGSRVSPGDEIALIPPVAGG